MLNAYLPCKKASTSTIALPCPSCPPSPQSQSPSTLLLFGSQLGLDVGQPRRGASLTDLGNKFANPIAISLARPHQHARTTTNHVEQPLTCLAATAWDQRLYVCLAKFALAYSDILLA
ncbi:hypothetical protein BCR44DRAFT_1441536, partial [Catenaria anguillulae PL171]